MTDKVEEEDVVPEIIRVPSTRLLKRSDSFYEPGAVTKNAMITLSIVYFRSIP